MKPLSERDENQANLPPGPPLLLLTVGMKPLSERDENLISMAKLYTNSNDR